mmetsp:Transcript_36448/g.47833  ORF Transcript_36448/g.47833 Transcript_36448/m.47833 type:complete len:131 (+) Transcript_36448:973-1365(+)
MLYYEVENRVMYWIVIGIGMITVATISAMNFNYHMIWVTAMIGAYVVLQGVSMFAARWPIDLNLPQLVEAGAVTKIDDNFKIYMFGWICLSAVGIVLQCTLLWYLKKTGRRLHPNLKKAVDAFEHGRTAE